MKLSISFRLFKHENLLKTKLSKVLSISYYYMRTLTWVYSQKICHFEVFFLSLFEAIKMSFICIYVYKQKRNERERTRKKKKNNVPIASLLTTRSETIYCIRMKPLKEKEKKSKKQLEQKMKRERNMQHDNLHIACSRREICHACLK